MKGDDAFLVFDRNGNGNIDSGRELFGDSTALYAGGSAADGFAALAQEDTNGDGLVNASDANWNSLRLWRDLNQDGISQTNELLTLASQNISALKIGKTANSQTLANGNQIADLGGYIKTDGSEGSLGEVTGNMGDINLADNPFYSEFTDPIALTDEARGIADMQGAGMVRDLREAASLDGTLVARVNAMSGMTRAQMMNALDELLADWAETSGMETSMETAAGNGFILKYLAPGMQASDILEVFNMDGGGGTTTEPTPEERERRLALQAEVLRINRIIGILERFNGVPFVNVGENSVTTGTGQTLNETTTPVNQSTGETSRYVFVPINAGQLSLLEQSYVQLKESVYGGLVVEARLKPYLDQIGLTIDTSGIRMDFGGLETMLDARYAADRVNTIVDAIDIVKYVGTSLRGAGWEGTEKIGEWISAAEADGTWPSLRATLLTMLPTSMGDGANVFLGTSGNDTAYASDGDDILLGGGGNDSLNGDAGNDLINGGSGNDVLQGGAGDDIFVFERSGGFDWIRTDSIANSAGDVVRLGSGIAPDQVDLRRYGNNLDIILKRDDGADPGIHYAGNTTDRIVVEGYFSGYKIKAIEFSDGSLWDKTEIEARFYHYGGDGNDSLIAASDMNNRVRGLGGNDTLSGGNGNDILEGGDGDDNLHGNNGDDILDGGAGTDNLYGGAGKDSYLFNRGTGIDWIYTISSTSGTDDVIRLGADITPAEIELRRYANNLDVILNKADGTTERQVVVDYFAGYPINRIEFADGTVWNQTEIHSRFVQYGGDGNDSLIAASGMNNRVRGLGGNDSLSGGNGNDTLEGGDGDDNLHGGDGDDFLDGGAGTDNLYGGAGKDTYLFNRGTGIDWIRTSSSTSGTDDVIRLGTDITPAEIELRRYANNLDVILNKADGSTERMVVERYFDGYQINRIEFADGTVWNQTEIHSRFVQYGGSGNDSLAAANLASTRIKALGGNDLVSGGTGADHVEGGDGDDSLFGYDGDDILDGGTGTDNLYGGAGKDVYVFNRGYGRDWVRPESAESKNEDVVRLGEGIRPENVRLLKYGSNIDIALFDDNGAWTGDTLILVDYFSYEKGKVKAIEFADGTIWDDAFVKGNVQVPGTSGADTLTAAAGYHSWLRGYAGSDTLSGSTGNDYLDGGDGDDYLFGYDGDDILDGGAGRDYLYGGAGKDVYLLRRGGGVDFARPDSATSKDDDVIRVAADITPAEIRFFRYGNNIDVALMNPDGSWSGTTMVLVDYVTGAGRIKSIDFADGTSWDDAYIRNHVEVPGGAGNDTLYAVAGGNSVVRGYAGYDTLSGDTGNDTLYGGNDDDYLYGNGGNDTLLGEAGIDRLYGGAGNDVLDGGTGNDHLEGGAGNDTYVWGKGYGVDGIVANDTTAGRIEKLVLKDVLPSEIRIDRWANNLNVVLSGKNEWVAIYDYFAGPQYQINYIEFADGTIWNQADIHAQPLFYWGASGNDSLTGRADGVSVLKGLDGSDSLYGNASSDVLDGGNGNDILNGQGGNDFLQGMAGDDSLTDTIGSNMLSGGSGIDTLVAGAGADLLIGGQGNDTLTVGSGNDVIAMNKGDGFDTINVGTGSKTLSLGGGIAYGDLSLRKSGNDLILDTAAGEGLTLKNWYASASNQNVLNLQVIAEAMADFDACGSDPLRDQKIESFDFKGLVGAFDAALASTPGLTSWALTNALATFQLAGSDTAAIGGDLAYQYGKNGTLAGIGMGAAQQVVGEASFGTQAQTLRPLSSLQEGVVRLS